MPNQQLLDYIKQQMQLGVPQEAIKNALLTSGWPSAEVEEALKPVGGAPATAAAKPAAQAVSPVVSTPKIDSVTKAAAPAAASPFSGSASPKTDFFQVKEAVFQPGASATIGGGTASGMGENIKKHLLTIILGVVVILLLAGVGYLYARNSALSNQLGGAATSSGGGSDLLTQQVAALNSDKTTLQSQLSSVATDNTRLKTLLGLFAVPDAAAPTSSTKALPISVHGKLSEAKAGFTLTTPEEIAVSVKNYKDAKVSEALKKYVGSNNVTLDGTYDIGTPAISVEKINGQTPDAILNPPVAPTSTPPAATTSTPPATTTPPAAPASTTPPAPTP